MSDEKKVIGKPFGPGNRANPGGRPKGLERRFRELVEGMHAKDPEPDPEDPTRMIPAFDAMIKRAVLDAVAGDDKARAFVFDRLMGKPKQTVDARITDNAPRRDWSQVPLQERVNLLEKIRAVPLVGGELPDDDRVH